jgi:uncharacterized protein YigE (DUF2233 family)
MKPSWYVWISFGLWLMVFGCGPEEPSQEAAPSVVVPPEGGSAPRKPALIATFEQFRGQDYVLVKVAPERAEIRFFNPKADGGVHTFASVASLARQAGKTPAMIANGGMFRPDHSAQGLLVIDGETLSLRDTATSGYGNFYLQPNGIFALDHAGCGYVVLTQAYPALTDRHDIRYATQSGPMMLIDSTINPLFTDGSPNLYIRNAVGITAEGEVIFAISEQPCTFFDLSSVLLQHGCTDALYLDGAISRMYVPTLGVGGPPDSVALGPLIGVFR